VKRFSQKHLSNDALRHEIKNDPAREGEVTAMSLARLAEYDARKLYLPDGFPSMLAYCMAELRLSEDEAKKRIRVARAGHRCPSVFEALADGRVNLSGLVCLARHLTAETADELLAAASHKTRHELEHLIAERFPRADVAARVEAIPPAPLALAAVEGAPGPPHGADILGPDDADVAPGCAHDRGRVRPLSRESYAVQFTRSREDDERFRYLQDLLGHQVARGNLAKVYDRAVRELIAKMERVRFGACAKPRKGSQGASTDTRYVPAQVKREVWQRDGGRCTFVSESGRRCEARGEVEFDHVKEFARGGETTVDGLRLRCRGHNQYTAEQTFGVGFMQHKRVAAAGRAAKAQAGRDSGARTNAEGRQPDVRDVSEDDAYKALRTLGYRAGESRRALALCADMPGASSEERLRRALTYFPQRGRHVERFA
jgi:hypothetical protein